MNSTTLIWLVVGIIVVLVIVGIIIALVATARGRREHRMEVQHDKAEQLRSQARETELAAKQHEADIARAQADAAAATAAAEAAKANAAQAKIDAERRASTIPDHQAEAQKLREQQNETLRKADHVDPYVDEKARGDAVTRDDRVPADRAGVPADRAGVPVDRAAVPADRADVPADRADAADRTDLPDGYVEQRDDAANATPPITRRSR